VTTQIVRGPHEERLARLMRDADCNTATIIAVIQLGRALDEQTEIIDLLGREVMSLRERVAS
jgi:hypothetical protein